MITRKLVRLWLPVFLTYGLASRPQNIMGQSAAQMGSDVCGRNGLPEETYKKVLNAQFSGLLGSADVVPGSFGALEIDKEQKATLAAASQPRVGTIVSVKASGGVQDGVLGLISGKQASTSFSTAIDAHFLGRGTMLEYTNKSCRAWQRAHRAAEDSLALWLSAINGNAQEVEKRSVIARYVDSIRIVDSLLRHVSTSSLGKDTLRVDSLRLAARKRLAESITLDSPERQRFEAQQKQSELVRVADALLEVTGFSLGWFSLTASVENTTFKRFTPALPVDSQITKDAYAAPRVGLAYSRYTLSQFPNESRFWSFGVSAGMEHNLEDLSKVELTDSKQFGATPDERVSKRTSTAFEGAYQDNIRVLSVEADWYQFAFRENQVALHLSPGVSLRQNQTPTYTAGIGLLWTARKEGAAFFNAELQFGLTDITEAKASPDNVWERSQLGLKLAFPILLRPR